MTVSHFFFFSDPVHKSLHGQSIIHAEFADAGASQGGEIGATTECASHIKGQAADIRASGADDTESDDGSFDASDLEGGDPYGTGLQDNILPFPGHEVGGFTVALDGGMRRRHLQDVAGKGFGSFTYVRDR